MDDQRVDSPDDRFGKVQQEQKLKKTTQQTEREGTETGLAGKSNAGEGCTEKNAEYQKQCAVEIE